MRRLAQSSALLLAALVAACTPSTFEGLTGGKDKKIDGLHESDPNATDETLRGKDPRPVSPFSGAWVNTARPKFTWRLEPGTAGATVEVSTSRDFADPQRFRAAGSELTVEKDLEPGMYFWRLQARSASSAGVSYSPIWTLLVRGKAKNAKVENTAAHGGLMDVDGNGIPDLGVTFTTREDPTGEGKLYELPTFAILFGVGERGKPTAFDPFNFENVGFWDVAGDSPAIAAGFDMNGDGYGDAVFADIWTASTPSSKWYDDLIGGAMIPLWGSPPRAPASGEETGQDDAPDDDAAVFLPSMIVTQPFTKVPPIVGGDFNGDGFGDLSAVFDDMAVTVQGNRKGTSFSLLPFDSPGANPPTSFFISAGDFDGDGLSDLAYTPFDLISPLRLSKGSTSHYSPGPNLSLGSDIAAPTRAIAMAAGDFDGDGFDEVAFSTTIGGKGAVCVSSLSSGLVNAHSCWISDAPVAGFGGTMGAGDTDGDGVDEIFVGLASGVVILTHAGAGFSDDTSVFTAQPVTGPYTSRFSVFYPGRPGPAQWAVYGTDNRTLFVITGKGETASIMQYDFTNLKNAKDAAIEFLHFGHSIR